MLSSPAIAQLVPPDPAAVRPGDGTVAWTPDRGSAAPDGVTPNWSPLPPFVTSGAAATVATGGIANPRLASSLDVAAPAAAATSGGQLARLIRNPKQQQGLPPFALADRAGQVQRYVEPVEGIDLERFVDQVVIVHHDTGRTLLASQLELPWNGPFVPASADVVGSRYAPGRRDPAVRPAQYVEHADYRRQEPELADRLDAPESEVIPPPGMTEEMIPTPRAVDPHYPDGYHSPQFEPNYEAYDEPYYEPCPHCSGGNYSGGYCPHGNGPHYQYDRGLLGGCLDGCCRPTGCGPGARGYFYARGEYLSWWFDGMNTPLLVVGGTIVANPDEDPMDPDDDFIPQIDEALFGGDEIFDEQRDGGRITVGWFLDPCGFRAIEGDYLTFGSTSTGFFAEGEPGGLGDPYIGRPVFRLPIAAPIQPDVEDVVFTDIGGSVAVDIVSDFESAGLRLRHNICCVQACQVGCGDCCDTCTSGCCGSGPCQRGGYGTRRIDLTFGVRYANLEERLAIVEDLQQTDNNQFLVTDSFGTDNDFYGGELGFVWEWEYCRWKLDLLSRLAVGNTRQRVVIDGSTVVTPPAGPASTLRGGILALDSNIGSYETDKLAVLPEVGVTLGYRLTCNLSFTMGYSFLYWSSVVRPGDQIDLDVNPAQIPIDNGTPTPADGPFDRPRPFFNQTDFFAHGVNIGLEYRR